MSTHLAFRARCAGRRGFTLVEAMVATAVFAVSIASVLGLSRWIVQATRANGRSAEAVNLAQAKIESFNHGFYSQVESGSDRVGLYDRTWTVDDLGRKKHIRVRVEWPMLEGQRRSMEVETILARW